VQQQGISILRCT